MPKRHSVTIRGRRYASCAEAARALGVAPSTVEGARERGTLDDVGLGPKPPIAPVPTVWRGVLFPSQCAAGRALGVRQQTIYGAVERGTLDRLEPATKGLECAAKCA